VPVTCEAGNTGEGMVGIPAVPRPGSVTNAAMRALIEFSKEERLVGAACAHDSFDGILAEHALALEEARDMLREALAQGSFVAIGAAIALLDEQITHIRALGSVAQKEETDGAG
jgi:hypothetical protein